MNAERKDFTEYFNDIEILDSFNKKVFNSEERKKNISIKKNDMYQARLKKIYKKYS